MTTLPLHGKRVLITRAKAQSSKLQQQLEAAGAEVIAIPAIEIIPPDSYASLDTALQNIVGYDWLVLTSANAVSAIAARAKQISVPIETLASVYIAAIGKATADAITQLGLAVELIPPRAIAESLADALAPLVSGKRVLIIRAKVARDVLPQALEAAGADVTIAEAYQTTIPSASAEMLREAFAKRIDAITFTSASSVHNMVALTVAADLFIPDQVEKISIGPITTAALAEHGWRADAEATDADVDSMVAACVSVLST